MKASRKIIVLVDFLENTAKVVNYAVSMATGTSSAPHFIHVVDVYKDDPLLVNPFVDRCEKRLVGNAEQKMTELLAETASQEPTCTGEVVTGKPLEKLIELAHSYKSDLIMISPDSL